MSSDRNKLENVLQTLAGNEIKAESHDRNLAFLKLKEDLKNLRDQINAKLEEKKTDIEANAKLIKEMKEFVNNPKKDLKNLGEQINEILKEKNTAIEANKKSTKEMKDFVNNPNNNQAQRDLFKEMLAELKEEIEKDINSVQILQVMNKDIKSVQILQVMNDKEYKVIENAIDYLNKVPCVTGEIEGILKNLDSIILVLQKHANIPDLKAEKSLEAFSKFLFELKDSKDTKNTVAVQGLFGDTKQVSAARYNRRKKPESKVAIAEPPKTESESKGPPKLGS